jgi:hypothetical protein
MSIIPECERPGNCRGRPLTATQCALAIVTAGLAVAAAMLALIASAGAAQASQAPATETTAERQGSVFAEIEAQTAPLRQGSVFSEFQPQVGPYRGASVFSAFQPLPEPTFTPFPRLSPSPVPGSGLPSMGMPVDGTWEVTCGYRCGLHTAANKMTFALDIVAADGDTAGQPVRAPFDGRITAVGGIATYFCNGQWIYGPSGGTAVVIDSEDDTGTTWRLRLIHLDAASIADDLRPAEGPVQVRAGTVLGNLAPLDGCPHLHMDLTRLDSDGESPHPFIINGLALDDCGGEDCWLDTLLPPQAP